MILNIILIAVIAIQTLLHYIERRDMYNRLMSKNLAEYNNMNMPPPKHIPSAHELTLRKWRNTAGDDK